MTMLESRTLPSETERDIYHQARARQTNENILPISKVNLAGKQVINAGVGEGSAKYMCHKLVS